MAAERDDDRAAEEPSPELDGRPLSVEMATPSILFALSRYPIWGWMFVSSVMPLRVLTEFFLTEHLNLLLMARATAGLP